MGALMRGLFYIMILTAISITVKADVETDDAISEVQSQMQNAQAFKNSTANNSKEAASTQRMVEKLSGNPENEKDIYKLAADILGNMKGQSPEEMQKILEQAQKDPEGFASKFSPEQRKKLEEIAGRIPANSSKKP